MLQCSSREKHAPPIEEGQAVLYQVFARRFGNRNTTNKPWGTIEENGAGKFSDFTGEGAGRHQRVWNHPCPILSALRHRARQQAMLRTGASIV